MKNNIRQKQTLREKFKKVRDGISMNSQQAAARKIAARLFKMPEFKTARIMGLYLSKDSEVRTFGILNKILQLKKRAAVPKTSASGSMRFHSIRGLQDCRLGAFNVLEPRPRRPVVKADQIDLLIVPGLLFDKKGHRLGYGKGFYDKFLGKTKPHFLIGLTYENTLVTRIPNDCHDHPVQTIITEKKIYRIPQ